MLKGFKEFIMRGNVVDLAVGVAIGAAFNSLVTAMTSSFIEPLVKVVSGGGEVAGTFTINEVVFNWGAFVNAIIAFIITAAVIYFVVVVPMNALRNRRDEGKEDDVEPSDEEKMIALLEEIAKNSKS